MTNSCNYDVIFGEIFSHKARRFETAPLPVAAMNVDIDFFILNKKSLIEFINPLNSIIFCEIVTFEIEIFYLWF
jgi:hypothetical protein